MINRKKFLEMGTLGLSGLLASPSFAASVHGIGGAEKANKKTIKFGIITDLHYDLMHDSDRRAQLFIDAMNTEQPDFIISLGDFCVPKPSNQNLTAIWAKFKGKKHFVLGNHDTDGGFTKEQALAFWGAEKPYYSFDDKGFHFVVLDGNEKDPQKKLAVIPAPLEKSNSTGSKKISGVQSCTLLFFAIRALRIQSMA